MSRHAATLIAAHLLDGMQTRKLKHRMKISSMAAPALITISFALLKAKLTKKLTVEARASSSPTRPSLLPKTTSTSTNHVPATIPRHSGPFGTIPDIEKVFSARKHFLRWRTLLCLGLLLQ
jgi:hypothetical protein